MTTVTRCECGSVNHEDQRKWFPVGTVVSTIIEINNEPDGEIPAGSIGKVTAHCGDGRAWVLFDGYPHGHTFHDINLFVRIIKLAEQPRTEQPASGAGSETERQYYKASDVAIELGHSPLPWRVVDFGRKSGSETAAINIDCHVPRGGGTGMTVAELFYYKSWQDSKVPRSVVEANAELIVKAVNQHSTLVEQRDRLLRAAKFLLAMNATNYDREVMRSEGGFDALQKAVDDIEQASRHAVTTIEQEGETRG